MTEPSVVEPSSLVGVPGRTFTTILSRAQALHGSIRESGAQAESERHLPSALVAQLRETGVFSCAVPAEWGGADLTSAEQTRIIEALSRADVSVGWCVMIGMDSGIYARYLSPEAARAIFRSPDLITAGQVAPLGRGEPVDGGYLVNGDWRFASGSNHADVMAAGFRVAESAGGVPAEKGTWKVLLAKPEQFEFIDSWYSTGLAGTGSRDYVARDLFVPAGHVISFERPVHPGILTRRSDALVRKMAGVALGAGRAALDVAYSLAEGKGGTANASARAGTPRARRVVAECELQLSAARALVYGSLDEQWEHLLKGEKLGVAARARAALSRYNAFRSARQVIEEVYDLVGGAAVYSSRTPLDRLLRDIVTACQHVVAQHQMIDWVGELLSGQEPDTAFI
ncbi:acyl-CoA dehydrogenase family protein [Blastococcus sp. TF02A_35]|uniref:acyl-CoA dehydrogenase family protein n=1 Tax=Blastococcus sp. TF02A-35 TaxID=2559612 RepID=UPI00142FDC18|nr:acyl-CoA dehydrogenase family protein [Blastococcus sp. TF02A_35]